MGRRPPRTERWGPVVRCSACLSTSWSPRTSSASLRASRLAGWRSCRRRRCTDSGADAEQPAAVDRVFAVKGRPATHPLIVHIGAVDDLDRWVADVPPSRRRARRDVLAGTAHAAAAAVVACPRRGHRWPRHGRHPRARPPGDARRAGPHRGRPGRAVGEPLRRGESDDRRSRPRGARRRPRPGDRRHPRRRSQPGRRREHDRRLHRRPAADPASRAASPRRPSPSCSVHRSPPPPARRGRPGWWRRTTRRGRGSISSTVPPTPRPPPHGSALPGSTSA